MTTIHGTSARGRRGAAGVAGRHRPGSRARAADRGDRARRCERDRRRAVRGRDAIREAVDGFFATIAGCRHDIRNSFGREATLFCEGEVTYRRHDGSEISLPFADVFEYEGDLIAHYKIYLDIGPLYA